MGGPSPTPTEATAGSPTPDPSPTLPPISLTGQIAYLRSVDGNQDIYLMNLDRTGSRRLTEDPASDDGPLWSADGEHIVFSRAGDIYSMGADGSEQRRLTSSADQDHHPAFSPDGTTIAFGRGSDPTFELRIMDADGSNQRLVYEEPGAYLDGPRWASDGNSLFFTRDAAGVLELWRVDIATRTAAAVAADSFDNSTYAVSQDGSMIAFQSDRDPGGLFIMASDGSDVSHVTGSWTKGYGMSWGPDGDSLIFENPDGWLYLVRTDGTELTRWAEGRSPAWRPIP